MGSKENLISTLEELGIDNNKNQKSTKCRYEKDRVEVMLT